jgi:hypothetical protein
MFEKWNYSIVSKKWACVDAMRDTTHGAYAISEYNQVYAGLICGTQYLGAASLLTSYVKPLVASRRFDCTKDDKIITELWEQLEFLAWFPL